MNADIFTLARKLMKKYRTNDPYRLADYLGIVIRYFRCSKLKGMYRMIDGINFIWLNEALDEITMRIVLMHEIGHYLLHRDLAVNAFQEFTLYDMTGKTEKEANVFAANMLLSDKEIIELAEYGYTSAQAAAVMYVPHQLMLIKIEDMIDRGFTLYLSEEIRSDFLAY
ncbi:MAG: ImmA/IrrE family metallo-endopeptidase [Ruminiclostridium sp.]|nr:ImmA/IrrE family metallo-endopeptidase [Ruminiclostridium sp.]